MYNFREKKKKNWRKNQNKNLKTLQIFKKKLKSQILSEVGRVPKKCIQM